MKNQENKLLRNIDKGAAMFYTLLLAFVLGTGFATAQSQMLNGISMNGPLGYEKVANLQWKMPNTDNLIVIHSTKGSFNYATRKEMVSKDTRTTEFIGGEVLEISGVKYFVGNHIGDNGALIGSVAISRAGYTYIVLAMSTGDGGATMKELVSEATDNIYYALGYEITRITTF